jgi:putative ABC transport system permease protein
MHFDDGIKWLNVSNVKYSYILSGIAFAVLFIACINYILLSLAGSLSRSKEIGVRKVMGASGKMIRFQFFGESLILVGISCCISIVIVSLILPQFNSLMNRQLGIFQWTSFSWIIILFGIVMITGFIAGGYPALILSRLIPQKVLKSNANGNYKARFSLYLIVFQFSTCFVLLTCTMVMLSQMSMIQTKDLGFNRDQVVVVDLANDVGIPGSTILDNFRSELGNELEISKFSSMGSSFGSASGSSSRTDSTGKVFAINTNAVNFDFFEMLDIKLVEGRFFSRDHPSDIENHVFVVNESFVRQEGRTVGQQLYGRDIIGVVKDFNFQSLNNEVKPWAFSLSSGGRQMLVKIQTDNIPTTIAKLERTWIKVVGSGRLPFTFLDDHINKQYERYTQWIRIISISAFLAIAITGLGLLGIISLAVINRTREIGIRKVLGASINSIVALFSNRYALLIVLAFIIAIPIANHFSTVWLQDFAYKTEIGFIHYVIPFLVVGVFTLVIIASQVVRAAKANPVDSIRYE